MAFQNPVIRCARASVCLALGLWGLLASPDADGAVTTTIVAREGDLPDGATYPLGVMSDFTIAEQGDQTFVAFMDGRVLWLSVDGELHRVAGDQDGLTETVFDPIVASDGRVLYSVFGQGLWVSDGSASTKVIAIGDPCPDGSARTVSSFGSGNIAGDGTIATALTCGPSVGPTDIEIYTFAPGATRRVYPGMNVPGFRMATDPPTLQYPYDTWLLSSSGKISFEGRVLCTGDPLCQNQGFPVDGFFLADGASVSLLHSGGAFHLGMPPEFRSGFWSHRSINARGDVAFVVEASGVIRGIFKIVNGGLRPVAIEGDAAPGTSAKFEQLLLPSDSSNQTHTMHIGDDGFVTFTAALEPDGPVTIWQEDGSGLRRIAYPGLPLNRQGPLVAQINAVRVSPSGQVAMEISDDTQGRTVFAQTRNKQLSIVVADGQEIGDTPEPYVATTHTLGGIPFGSATDAAKGVYGNGDGRGMAFTAGGKLVFAGSSAVGPSATLLVADLEGSTKGTALHIELEEDAWPWQWGTVLQIEVTVHNLNDEPVSSFEVGIEFSPLLQRAPDFIAPDECFYGEEASGIKRYDCFMEDPIAANSSATVPFRLLAPIKEADADLTMGGEANVRTISGLTYSDDETLTFNLSATPREADLSVEIDPIAAEATGFKVRNSGPRPAADIVAKATGVFIDNTEDAACELSPDGNEMTCKWAKLDPFAEVLVDFPDQGYGSGTLTVSSATHDPNLSNNFVEFTIGQGPDDAEGCGGCRATPSSSLWALGLLVLLLRRAPRSRQR